MQADTGEEPGGSITYATTSVTIIFDTDGSEYSRETAEGQGSITCDESGCITDGLLMLSGQENPRITLVNGVYEQRFPGETNPCAVIDNRVSQPFSVRIEATADGVHAVTEYDTLPWADCGDDDEAMVTGILMIVDGVYLSGEPCVLDRSCAMPEPSPEPTATAVPSAAPLASGQSFVSTSLLGTGDPGAPSILSGLASPGALQPSVAQVIAAAVTTIVLVLLMAYPTSLLNRSVDTLNTRATNWWQQRHAKRRGVTAQTSGPVVDAAAPAEQAPTGFTQLHRGFWWASIGVLVAAVISSFADPEFGLNPGSARVIGSIFLAFAVKVILGWFVLIWFVRRIRPDAEWSFDFAPLTLLVVALTVAFTRVTGFEPGIIFGLVAGVTFAAAVGARQKAKATLVSCGYAFGLALIAWALYGLFDPESVQPVEVFFRETLAGLVAAGIVSLPLVLLPVKGLSGYAVFQWNRAVWGICYAIGLFSLFTILIPMPRSWGMISRSLGTWIAMYLCYAAVAVGVWLLVVKPWQKEDRGAAPSVSDEEGDTVDIEVGS